MGCDCFVRGSHFGKNECCLKMFLFSSARRSVGGIFLNVAFDLDDDFRSESGFVRGADRAIADTG